MIADQSPQVQFVRRRSRVKLHPAMTSAKPSRAVDRQPRIPAAIAFIRFGVSPISSPIWAKTE